MAWSPRTRWIIYGAAGLATLVAMQWVDENQEAEVAVVPAAPRPTTGAPAAQQAAEADAQVRLEWLRRRPGEEVPRSDPFSARPPGAPAPEQQAAPPPPPPPPPPQAPPLPFTYMGKWTENGQTTVYLSQGERHVAVRGPGKLNETYVVESIDDRQMVLNYVPLGIRQVLPLAPGAPAAQAAGAAPASAPQEESTEETN
jgi:hypothetical protein